MRGGHTGKSIVKVGGDFRSLELKLLASALKLLCEQSLDVVYGFAHFGTKRNVQLGNFLEKLGDRALLAKKRALYLSKLGFTLSRLNFCRALFKERI